MAGETTTRKSVADFVDSIKDNICILPGDILSTYLEDRKKDNEDLCAIFSRIVSSLESRATEDNRHHAVMEAKMDELIRTQRDESVYNKVVDKLEELTDAVTKTSTILLNQTTVDGTEQLQKNILKLKELRGQYLRAEKLSSFTEEHLAKSPPFVQQKFRTKVSKDTPVDELESYKDIAIQRAKSECDILKIRMRRWEEEITELKSGIEEALSNPNLGRLEKAKFEEQMKKNEEANTKERDEAIKKIVNTTNEELNSEMTQFLLKYVEDGDSEDDDNTWKPVRGNFKGPKNFRGRFPRGRNRRGQQN